MLNMSQKIYQVHKNKVVPVYANPMAENRCFVKLLDLYQTSYDLYVYIFVRKKKEFQMILLLPDLIQHPWGSIKLCQACVKWKRNDKSQPIHGLLGPQNYSLSMHVPEKMIQEHRSTTDI